MSENPANHADNLRYWLGLHRAPLVGSRRFRALLAHFGTPRAVFDSGFAEWTSLNLPERTIAYLQAPDWAAVDRDLEWIARPGCHCLTLEDPRYPALLQEIADPPPLLFLHGDPASLSLRHIAVVGSRNPSAQGIRTAHDLASALVAAGFGVASGLALGIDAAGHRGALDGGGVTVAVAGTGPDRVYPEQHRTLVDDIVAQGGSLVSEFPPGTEPKAGNFPSRNRIISGLALGTLVVEATMRSGSLITSRLASEQGREVFAVPGSIHNPLARGCNDLIKQGAKLVQSIDDILEEFEFRAPAPPPPAQAAGDTPLPGEPHLQLLKYVAYDPTSVDTLVAATGMAPESIASMLLLLELQGYIESTPGGCYTRVR